MIQLKLVLMVVVLGVFYLFTPKHAVDAMFICFIALGASIHVAIGGIIMLYFFCSRSINLAKTLVLFILSYIVTELFFGFFSKKY